MRFHFDDIARHRRVARALPALLRPHGPEVGHTAAADIAARLFGYADANELRSCLGRAPASAWDEDEAPAVVAARRARQVAVLAGLGIAGPAAEATLDALRPTARDMGKSKRAGKASATTATARGPAVGPDSARPDRSSIDELLDAWEGKGSCDPETAVHAWIRRVYDGGFTGLSLDVGSKGYKAVAFDFDRREVLERQGGRAHGRAIRAWLDERENGSFVVDVSDGHLRVAVRDVSIGSQELVLSRSKRVGAPRIVDYGFEAFGSWFGALTGRVGLHVLCCPAMYGPEGFGRIVESLSDALAQKRIRFDRRDPIGGSIPDMLGAEEPDFEMIRLGDEVRTVSWAHWQDGTDFDLADLFHRGSSAILLSGDADPAVTLRRLLTCGVPSAFLRRVLLTTAVRVDLPGARRTRNPCEGMRWRTEIRIPLAEAA